MPTYYVDSNATGADDGTSFTDAFPSVTDIPTLVNGDVVLVASDHSDSLTDYDFPSGGVTSLIPVISVNSGTEAKEDGASITCSTSLSIPGVHIIGFTLTTTVNLDGATANEPSTLEDCTVTTDSLFGDGMLIVRNCDFTCTDTSFFFGSLQSIWYGGSISGTSLAGGDGIYAASASNTENHEMYGVDLSGLTGAFDIWDGIGGQGHNARIRMVGCRLPPSSGFVNETGIQEFELELIGCETGTITDPTIQYRYQNRYGIVESDDTVTRTDGASDGTTPYTLQMTATGGRTIDRIKGIHTGIFGITRYVEPGDTNLRIYLAHDAVGQGTAGALDDGECWAEYLGPSEAATATTQLARLTSTRSLFGETASDLTADGSTWSGTGVGTEQRIDIAIDPTEAGYATVWVHFAPGDASDVVIHVDPNLDVT